MITRRNFLKTIAAASVLYPFGKVFGSDKIERSLKLYNIHTDENLDISYFTGGSYDFEALDKINYLLRCHYSNAVKQIDMGSLTCSAM